MLFTPFAGADAAGALVVVRLGIHPHIVDIVAINDSLPTLPILMKRASCTLTVFLKEPRNISTAARDIYRPPKWMGLHFSLRYMQRAVCITYYPITDRVVSKDWLRSRLIQVAPGIIDCQYIDITSAYRLTRVTADQIVRYCEYLGLCMKLDMGRRPLYLLLDTKLEELSSTGIREFAFCLSSYLSVPTMGIHCCC